MEPKVEEVGRLFIVDPNPPGSSGLEQIPPEDLFIYVKFTATPRSRLTFEGQENLGAGGVTDEINFISSEIRYSPDGKLDPQQQETFTTTNWTGIGGESSSGGVLEGFGIKSIDIKYNASLVPVVDITFTDVRGAGLFDTIKDNDRQSPYSIFFKMPYPIFKLSVKGYFGQSVEYCLHMVNWNSNFDGSTGNFDITANFLGFQQAFLNDMNMGNVIANVNTEEGRTQLDSLNWTYKDKAGNDFTIPEEIRKIDDFFLKIAKLQIDAEVLKSDSKGFDELKDLNGQRKLLRQLQSFIGAPIAKDSKEDVPDIDYLKQKNSTTITDGNSIKDTILIKNNNYLVIRDYLIINSINITAYKNYISTLTNGINEYKAYIAKEDIDKTKIKGKDDVKDYDIALSNELMESFLDDPLTYVDGTTKNSNSIESKKLSEILNFMGFPLLQLSLTKDYEGSDNNTTFDIKNYNKLKNENAFYSSTLSADTNVFVVDFRKQRALLQNLIQTLDKAVIQKEKQVSEEINTELTNKFSEIGGKKTEFGPTIENCFRILANNTQALTATVYEITRKSVNVDFNTRNDILNENSYDTDIPKHIRETSSVAWPSVYRNNGDGSQTEIYLGEISGTEGVFPERDYIDKIFNALVSKQKSFKDITRSSATKNGLDTDNWFPINPLDYRDNPFLQLNTEQNIGEILDILANRFILRTAVLKNYSLFDSNTGLPDFSNYVSIDAINANLTIFNKDVRSILVEQLKDKVGFYENLKKTKFFKDNITEAAGNLTIQGTTDNPIKIGNVKIGGLADENVDYIDFDTDGIINNSKSLWPEIKKDQKYENLINGNTSVGKDLKDGPFLVQKYTNSNLNSNILYNVWDDEVGKRLYNDNNNIQSTLNITNINSVNISGSTADGKGKYLNKTNFIKPSGSEIQYSGIMTDSVLYKSQTSVNAKALLLLSTIPFKPFESAVLKDVFGGNYKGARILSLPKYYVYLIGGYLWRLGDDDLVFDGINTAFETPRTQYLTKLGYLASSTKRIELEPELINLPLSTKKKLIKEFEDWAQTAVLDNGSGTFETAMDQYYSDDSSISKENAESLMSQFKISTKMIIFAPKIFAKDDAGKLPQKLSVTEAEVKNYITYFANNFTKTNSGNDTDKSKDEDVNEDKNFKIKLSIYNYFKNINDKWVSDIPNSFSVCGDNTKNDSGKDLIDYFKFIDRGWRDIGDDAVFNLNSFLNLANEFKTSIYLFMSKLLRDSNFLFQILPTYIDFQTAEGVKKIFQPVTTLDGNASSGPIYACIYVGGASRVLDIQERDYGFKNDSFSFDDKILPSDFSEKELEQQEEEKAKKRKNSQVAFRVAFGAENQSIFKNVSLNQQEHKETGEYFKALSDLVDKRGGTQKTYQGTDLYKLFNTRSYTCKVDALGCMNIQPLMYFDLQNVPFFKGAYLITSVNHSITPNHMTTNFQGVRQSTFIAPPPKEITADLKIDFSESTDVSNPFTLDRTSTIGKYVIGVETPDGGFDFENYFTPLKFTQELGVSEDVATESNLTIFKTKCISNGIESNKQVCMFLANILTVSNNMANFKELNEIEVSDNKYHVPPFGDGTIYSGKTRHYGTNPPPTSSPFYDTYKGTTTDSISAITPTFTSTTNENTVVIDIKQDDDIGAGNSFVGDKWLFRPRGYLYVTGRKEYFTYKTTKPNFTTPWKLSLFPDTAFGIAVDVWKNKRKDGKEGTYENKTAFEICQESKGGADIYTRTFTIVGNEKEIDLYFQKFENVLLAFNLKKDFQLD
jgi:hypothetical protein